MGKKCQISIEQLDDKCFAIELSTGIFSKKHMVSETTDNLVLKSEAFIRFVFAGDKKG